MRQVFLLAVLILVLVCIFKPNIERFHNKCSGWDCPLSEKYPLKDMYQFKSSNCKLNCKTPYYKRTFPECNPMIPGGCDNHPAIEYFHNLPKATCQPGCELMKESCNPHGYNYQNPRWKNSRFWNKQETNSELIGDSQWYPTPNMTS